MFDSFRRLILFLVGASLPIGAFTLVSIGNFHVTPFKVLSVLLLMIGVVQIVVTGRGLPSDRKGKWIILFLVSYVISTSMGLAVGIPFSVIFIRFTTFLSLVMFYFLIGYVVRTMRDFRVVLWALAIGGVVSVYPALFGLEQGVEVAGGTRFVGLSGQANVFGYDLAVVLPVAMALMFASRSRLAKTIAVLCGMSAVMGIILALSRSAFVAVAGMWVLWTIRSGSLDSVKYLVPALLALLLFGLLAPDAVTERIATMTDADQRAGDYSIQSRLFVYGLALKAFVTHPLAGVGNFGWFVWLQDQPTLGRDVGNVHNSYLTVAAYQGLLGLIPYAAYLRLSWGDFNRTRRAAHAYAKLRDPILSQLGHFAMFLQIAFFGTLLGNLFAPSLDSKSAWLVIALSTVCVSLAAQRVKEIEAEKAEQKPEELEDAPLHPNFSHVPGPSPQNV